jgi:hypothetical protein
MKSLIFTFCAMGIVFSVLTSMVDVSKFEKEFRLVFTTITITVLLSAFMQVDLSSLENFSLDVNPYPIEDISTEDYTQEQLKIQVEDSIKTFLEGNGISCENISVSINITDDNCISINKVTLLTDSFQQAKTLLTQNFGENLIVMEW